MLLIGNPLSHEGELYESHHAKSALYHQITISAFDSPNFRRKRFRVPGLVTPEDVEHHRRDWGDDSPLYIASVLGQFPDALEDSLTTRNHVDRAIARHEAADPDGNAISDDGPSFLRRQEPRPHDLPYRMGVDVARFGADESVICIRRGYRVERLIPLKRGLDNMQVADEVKAWTDALGINAVFVDGTGVGAGVVDRLGTLGVPVIGVDVGSKARRPSQFADLRAEIFWEVARLLREDAAAIPNDSVLVGQLLALRYDVSSTGASASKARRSSASAASPPPTAPTPSHSPSWNRHLWTSGYDVPIRPPVCRSCGGRNLAARSPLGQSSDRLRTSGAALTDVPERCFGGACPEPAEGLSMTDCSAKRDVHVDALPCRCYIRSEELALERADC